MGTRTSKPWKAVRFANVPLPKTFGEEVPQGAEAYDSSAICLRFASELSMVDGMKHPSKPLFTDDDAPAREQVITSKFER
jgi:hypothetical protein